MARGIRVRLGIPSWWWVGIPAVGLVYAAAAWWAPALSRLMNPEGSERLGRFFSDTLEQMSVIAAPYLALIVAFLWIGYVFRVAADARRLDRQTGLDSIRALQWREFEQLLAEAFRRQGYRIRGTGPGADGGVDMVLDGMEGRILVQAKQWRVRKVGVTKVRELLGVRTAQSAAGAMLVTSGRVTEEARRFARLNGIRLVEDDELERMIQAVQRSGAMRSSPTPRQSEPAPDCPRCGSPMVRRTARRGARAGEDFWGCPNFPKCQGTRDIG